MSEITRSELEGQTIELLPAREEMRHRGSFRLQAIGSACEGAACTANTGNGGNGGSGFSNTANDNGFAFQDNIKSVGGGGAGGSGGTVFGGQT